LATSTLETGNLIFSLAGFIGFYTLLLVAELYLMFKYARLGPSSLHTGRYDLEGSPTGGGELAVQPQQKRE
jgi:cytochrome d ubiquinol oxidase subunit I